MKDSSPNAEEQGGLTIALSKGRILQDALPLLARVGIRPAEDPSRSRKLVLTTNRPDLRLLIIRAQDVPTYVEYGAADIGIAGKDVMMEYRGDGLYEPLDLNIACCRLVVAGRPGTPLGNRRLRVATKYLHTTRQYFAAQGIQAEVIKLYGSMELAPLMGLADVIVDLVDTGNTLRANGLVALAHVADISSQLVVNKAAMKMKHARIRKLTAALARAVQD
ncbi:MAG: ATP phosphoribosyltransferase [Gammaproteobacteria bacterium]|nr:ATP phosphoribosyltransferase [Gammaproteobacteria bacterium]MCG3142775.1 ATP phosphoribosyltransferase [Gammaproteobacteria bacterium]